jgi:lipoprotein-anchoring transpeptidase ErfK/SrfK
VKRLLVLAATVAALAAPAAARADVEPLPDGIIAPGVSIAGVQVGGMTALEARAAVAGAYAADVTLAVGARRFSATAKQLGFHVYAANPVKVALSAGRTTEAGPRDIALVTRFAGPGLQRYLDHLDRPFEIEATDARLVLKGAKPAIISDKWGRRLDRKAAGDALVAALRDVDRPVVTVPFASQPPAVTNRALRSSSRGTSVVIQRDSHLLRLYVGDKLVRTFGVATGASSYPTPIGAFEVVTMQRHPWWYPPNSSWAAGAKPIPPGPSNPLGTRWMGLSSPGVGIHGTPNPASIGYSASHGCIRMRIPEAEWLFQHLVVGAPVWILRA